MAKETDTILVDYDPSVVEFEAMRGRFTGITYFMTTMSLTECAEQLRIAKPDEATTFAERIQRRLDKSRAENKIFKDYLLKPGNRFFNSLVVVLMPKKGTASGYFSFRSFTTRSGAEAGDLGKLKVLSDIDRVVVDGQHRLHALKAASSYTETDDYEESLQLAELQVPVVFVTFDDVDGGDFTKRNVGIVQQVSDRARKIFIDLNKGVVKADQNSLLLLDDENFAAVAARDLIENDADLEIYTKWDGAATTLPDVEPFYTNIYLLAEFVGELVPDESMPLGQYNLSLSEDRDAALRDLFYTAFLEEHNGIAPAEFIKRFFSEVTFFAQWKEEVRAIVGTIPKQPGNVRPPPGDRPRIAALRKRHLLSTVAGQRAAFMAVRDSYVFLESESEGENLGEALRSLSRIHDRGIYSRGRELWLELLTRPGNRMKLTTVRQAAKVLQHLITGDEEVDERLLQLSPEDGIGTEDTVRHYGVAMEVMRGTEET